MPRIAPAAVAAAEEEEEEPERWCFKLALLGDAGVGKTALVKRLLGALGDRCAAVGDNRNSTLRLLPCPGSSPLLCCTHVQLHTHPGS
jgi:hypothetical protein